MNIITTILLVLAGLIALLLIIALFMKKKQMEQLDLFIPGAEIKVPAREKRKS